MQRTPAKNRRGPRKLGDLASKTPCVGETKDKLYMIEQVATPKLLEGR